MDSEVERVARDHGATDSTLEWMRRATSNEPYHPDLLPYLYHSEEVGGQVLKHPLVVEVFPRPGIANYAYERKREILPRMIAEGKWHTVIFLHERPYRLDALTQYAHEMPDDHYWRLVSSVWTDSENVWQNLWEWRAVFNHDRPGREHLMDEDERLKLASLPEIVTIYRGCQREVNEDGLSYTLDRERAEWFALRWTGPDDEPIVIEATVRRDDILALFLGRNEEEVIVLDEHVTIVAYEEVQ